MNMLNHIFSYNGIYCVFDFMIPTTIVCMSAKWSAWKQNHIEKGAIL